MIEKIAELNRVLLAVSELQLAEGTADVRAVIDLCRSTVIEARMPKHEATISFAEQIGLLTTARNGIRLTEEGVGFVGLNPTNQYDLSEEQKRVLLRTCYLHGPLREQARRALETFSPALEGETLRWSVYDSPPLQDDWAAEHLSQLGLLRRRDDGWEVSADYTATVAVFLSEGKGWSEKEFKNYLREKEEVGRLGESLVKAFEMRRLTAMGHVVEARCVRRISTLRVGAGYDIESFDGSSPSVIYDRFIEVKGARGAELRFFWSENEIQAAKKLGERYWIYFQGGIDVAHGIARNEPVMLRDPAKSILADGRFKTTPQGLIVESALKGKAIRAAP